MVYIDRATKKPIAANISRDVPAAHPDTGERTLDPALWCPACKEWHVAPPLEVLQRNPEAARCAKTMAKLVSGGPWPE
jgi:hypothetical protein